MNQDDRQNAQEALPQQETAATEDSPGSDNSVNRRAFIGASAASIMGLALTQMSTETADAQTVGSHKQPRSSIMILPNAVAAQLAPLFVKNSPDLAQLYQYFSSQNMNFIPERAIVAVYEDEGGVGVAPSGPCMLLIWPTFRTFTSTDTSHEAASIVAIQKCGVIGGVLASHVVVSHNPFQISQFDILDINRAAGTIDTRSATRDDMKKKTAQQLAVQLGSPPIDPNHYSEMPSISQTNMTKLAGGTFAELLNDAYAAPLYPLGAIAHLLGDTSLVAKWSDAQRLRYSTVFSGMICCCSTSSNACTSTSSSFSISISA